MDTIGFFTSEEKKLFFSKYRLLVRNLYSFLEREDIRKMKELMKQFRATSDVIESNIFQSVHNINLRTVIGYHKDDEVYNFLDDYQER